MKKLILFLIVLFAVPVYSQVTLSSRTEITTLKPTDIMLWQTDAGGYKNRMMQAYQLRDDIATWAMDTIFTWTKTPVFSRGATFSAAGDGSVTFNDSVYHASGHHYVYRQVPASTGGAYSYVGYGNNPYWRMYATNFIVMNAAKNDSVSFSYDDSTLTIDKKVSFSQATTFSEDVSFDSTDAFKNVTFGVYQYPIANVGDSILTLQDTCATIWFSLPGSVTGIDEINFASGQGHGIGTVIRIINNAIGGTITFEDYSALNDGNLYLAGNYAMGIYDYLELVYMTTTTGVFIWVETGRSNN